MYTSTPNQHRLSSVFFTNPITQSPPPCCYRSLCMPCMVEIIKRLTWELVLTVTRSKVFKLYHFRRDGLFNGFKSKTLERTS